MFNHRIFFIFVLIAAVVPSGAPRAELFPIYAGASARSITPDLSEHDIYIAGFGMNRKATGIHDEIWARTLCLRVGSKTLAIQSVDLVGMMYPEYVSLIERMPGELEIDHFILTSTHNHEGPDVVGLWGPGIFKSGVNWDWYEEALDIMAEGVAEAYYSMEPAALRFGHGEAPGLSRDSREPIVMEEQVETRQTLDSEGDPIATMVFYSSHPEVLWDENTLITSDYPHYIYEMIEQVAGGTAIFVSGALGGLITPQTNGHTFEEAQRIGETIAGISLASLEGAQVHEETVLRFARRRLFIPMTNPMFRLASIVGLIERPVYHFRRDLLTGVAIGECGENGSLAQMAAIPGEDFPENWLEIKERMVAEFRLPICLGHDELGYIVPIEQWTIGGYEESMSASYWLDPELHNAILDMLTLND